MKRRESALTVTLGVLVIGAAAGVGLVLGLLLMDELLRLVHWMIKR